MAICLRLQVKNSINIESVRERISNKIILDNSDTFNHTIFC